MILDPGFDLTLRPMRYPLFYEMYRDAIKNTWTVEEVDFSTDVVDLERRLLPAERHLVNQALNRTGGNRTQAAKLLGISFRSLRYRLAKHGFSDSDAPKSSIDPARDALPGADELDPNVQIDESGS